MLSVGHKVNRWCEIFIYFFKDVYYTFNLVIRRDPKTNNFKAVLSTMRQLLNTECVVPDWLTDIVLGYGEPDSAHYSKWVSFEFV